MKKNFNRDENSHFSAKTIKLTKIINFVIFFVRLIQKRSLITVTKVCVLSLRDSHTPGQNAGRRFHIQ